MENLIQMDNPTQMEDSSLSDISEGASSSSSSDEDEDNVILASIAATQAILAAAKTVLLIEERSLSTTHWGRSTSGKAQNKDRDFEGTYIMIEQKHCVNASLGRLINQHEQQLGSKMKPKCYEVTSDKFVARYNGPSEDAMTAEQKKIRDAIVASRPSTGLSGPFGPWLAVPQIAQPAQALGRACRYGTSLNFQESELVILLTAAKTRSHSEFDIHVGEAITSGWTMDVVESIPRDQAFNMGAVKTQLVPLLKTVRMKAIAAYATELLETYSISDETYKASKQALDGKDSVLVEITSIVGYYTYVSYTLNAFNIPSK
jgi:4-carboxymuconolactone decarboxylase